jgi:hypothetical protein
VADTTPAPLLAFIGNERQHQPYVIAFHLHDYLQTFKRKRSANCGMHRKKKCSFYRQFNCLNRVIVHW